MVFGLHILSTRLRHGMTGAKAGLTGMMLAVAFAAMVGHAQGGSLDAPAAPDNTNSAIYTLADIYNVLVTGATTNKRTGGFTEPTGGPTNGTATGYTLDEVYSAAKVSMAIVPKSGVTTSYRAGDDGALEKGRPWPVPRFTVQADTNCVLDNLTGLMWARANQFGQVNWATAVANCSSLSYGGYDDWRLPNLRELYSLVALQYSIPALCNTAGTAKWALNDPFDVITTANSARYWTSTTCAGNTSRAHIVEMSRGWVYTDTAKTVAWYVWPVRGGNR